MKHHHCVASVLIVLLGLGGVASAQVDTAWVRTWYGPHNAVWGRLVATDDSGNVFAAGALAAPGGDSIDYAVAKYGPNGTEKWTTRYTGPGMGDDQVWDLCVDRSGNCIVTGESRGSGTEDDYATVKYLPGGDTAWVRRYDGPVNRDDEGLAVASDDSGNVYVTGWSIGDGTASDVATIKYDAAGTEQWVARWNGTIFIDRGQDVCADSDHNVYVVGQAGAGFLTYDLLVIKLTSDGDTAWVRTLNGPGNGWDQFDRVGVDGSGNVYACGFATMADTTQDAVVAKYTSTGDTAWVRYLDGPDSRGDWARDMVVDLQGECWVCGWSETADSSYDWLVARIDPAGNVAWQRSWDRGQSDNAWALASGDSGYLYVTGSSDVAPWLSDVATIKYDAMTGAQLWVSLYDGPDQGSDAPMDIAVGPDGLPVVAGATTDSTGTGMLVMKYTRTPGVEEGQPAVVPERRLPTVMSIPQLARVRGRLLDALGREVTDRKQGVSPGVYFLCPDDAAGQARKVVVQR